MKPSEVQAEHIKSLEWAFQLSRIDFSGLRAGDWMNLKEEYLRFVYGTTEPQFMDKHHPSKGVSFSSIPVLKRDDYLNVQNALKRELTKLAEGAGEVFVSGGEDCTLVTAASSVSTPFTSRIFVYNSFPDTQAVIALAIHLAGASITPAQIRICSAEQCKTLFLLQRQPRKDKKNFYCSSRCAGNEASRNWRKRNEEKLRGRENQRSHERYVKKQKDKYASGTTVKRRPRKQK